MHVCMYVFLQYLDRLTQFSLKLVKLWACINNDKTRTQHRELRSLLFARKVWVPLMSPAKQYKVYAEDGAHVYRSYLRR